MISMIRFSNVSKVYQKELFAQQPTALRGLSFELQQGHTLGLIGANGAGKSTTIKLIMDFIRPTEGDVRVLGMSPDSAIVRSKIGYLPEVASFPANLNILDLLNFAGRSCAMGRARISERSQELLSLLKLWDVRKQMLRTYSKGMQQRANFALALINDPELLILDEPMSGLDPIGRSEIIGLILDLKAQGKTILFCSHILEDVDKLVDRLLLLHRGDLVFSGLPDDFVRRFDAVTISDAFVKAVKQDQ